MGHACLRRQHPTIYTVRHGLQPVIMRYLLQIALVGEKLPFEIVHLLRVHLLLGLYGRCHVFHRFVMGVSQLSKPSAIKTVKDGVRTDVSASSPTKWTNLGAPLGELVVYSIR